MNYSKEENDKAFTEKRVDELHESLKCFSCLLFPTSSQPFFLKMPISLTITKLLLYKNLTNP